MENRPIFVVLSGGLQRLERDFGVFFYLNNMSAVSDEADDFVMTVRVTVTVREIAIIRATLSLCTRVTCARISRHQLPVTALDLINAWK